MMNRTTRTVLGTTLMAVAAVTLAAPPTSAQEEPAKDTEIDEKSAEIQQRLEETRERLQLTDEQVEQLVPLLTKNFESTLAVLEEHGIDLTAERNSTPRLNLRQMRSLSRDLDDLREAMYEKIEELGFLSDEQFAEFKKIQDEQRAAMREKLGSRDG